MKNKLLIIFGISVLILALSKSAFAGSCTCGGHGSCPHAAPMAALTQPSQPEGASQSLVSQPVKVGNKICPVMGGKVNENITYEYEGKIYSFCCPGCIDEFKKDPQKYVKIVEEEIQGGKEAQDKDVVQK